MIFLSNKTKKYIIFIKKNNMENIQTNETSETTETNKISETSETNKISETSEKSNSTAPIKKKGYIKWFWGAVKYYAQTSYYLSFVYGKIRGLTQPLISTEFNVQHVQDTVFIGDIASAYNELELKKLGITHIITAILGVDPQYPKDFVYLSVPIRDVESEDIKSHLKQTTQFIDDAVKSGGKVLIHCVYGISRSATIVAAWIMSRNGYTVDEAIHFLKKKRDCVDPNPAFRDQLEQFHSDNLSNF